MKIFGKRKNSKAVIFGNNTASADGENSAGTLSATVEVPSYFAQASTNNGDASTKKKKKKQRHDESSTHQPNGDDIQALLTMDPSKLNSKQRRLVRRHQEREGIEETNAVESAQKSSIEIICNASESSKSVPQKKQIPSQGMMKTDESVKSLSTGDESVETNSRKQQEASLTASITTIETLAKLQGLNSKDRRKFLRQLRSSAGQTVDESIIAAAEEQARKVAERNEQEAVHTNATCDTASKAKLCGKKSTRVDRELMVDQTKQKSKRRKKKILNLDDLDPEERKRREAQRIMQKEAAERRASGLVDPNRHPLNSERRRANRRKPGKAAKIVQAKKEHLAERGKFNAVGYQIRKKGGT